MGNKRMTENCTISPSTNPTPQTVSSSDVLLRCYCRTSTIQPLLANFAALATFSISRKKNNACFDELTFSFNQYRNEKIFWGYQCASQWLSHSKRDLGSDGSQICVRCSEKTKNNPDYGTGILLKKKTKNKKYIYIWPFFGRTLLFHGVCFSTNSQLFYSKFWRSAPRICRILK